MTKLGEVNPDVLCFECGSPMVLRMNRKFKGHGLFYGCQNWPSCKGIHSAHPDGTPMGKPADSRTRKARHEVHLAFDPIWRRRYKTRNGAYALLRRELGLTKDECHIGLFDLAMCERALEFTTRFFEDPSKFIDKKKLDKLSKRKSHVREAIRGRSDEECNWPGEEEAAASADDA